VVVNFWASWCEPCIEEFPDLVRAARTWRPRGVRFMSVSADDPKDPAPVKRALARFGAPFDSILIAPADAESVMKSFDDAWTGALPATFVYDASGRKLQQLLGKAIDPTTLDRWLGPLASSK
jgi:thiol-disulfide isomerase/thioredoxin